MNELDDAERKFLDFTSDQEDEEVVKEREEVKKEKKKHVCIDPDSVIGKEITYQTALLHEIRDAIYETKMLKENTERHPDKSGDQGGNDKELEIIILFKNPEIIPLMNEFIEERIMEIYRRHPYVKIHIEVEA